MSKELELRLRNKQAWQITKTKKNVSFSEIVTMYLEKGLKK